MNLTELPFNLSGRIFLSPMPFSGYDPLEEIADQYRSENVSIVVVLAEDRECLQKSGRNLREYYASQGFQVFHLPIPDFGVPKREALEQAVEAVRMYSLAGKHIAIHCHAGIGRTGMFAACLAKRIFGLSGEEAIQWVRKYVFEAVEAVEQRQLVLEF